VNKNTKWTPALIAEAVARGKKEILADIGARRVPHDVSTFSRLHDYVDANEYGGLCDDWVDPSTAPVNEIQGAIDTWLAARAVTGSIEPIVAIMFKHEDQIRRQPVGPVWMKLNNGTVINYQDHETMVSPVSKRPTPKWFTLAQARAFATSLGVPLEER